MMIETIELPKKGYVKIKSKDELDISILSLQAYFELLGSEVQILFDPNIPLTKNSVVFYYHECSRKLIRIYNTYNLVEEDFNTVGYTEVTLDLVKQL